MSLPARVIGLLIHPAAEWTRIAGEKTDLPSIYRSHVFLMAAIPAASILAGLAVSGGRYLGTAAIATAVQAALVGYVIALAVPMLSASALAALAPRFKSDGGVDEALKLVAYSMTPFWLAGLCYVSVVLSPLVIIGLLYGLWLLFLGATPVMGTPIQQRVPFTLVATITILAVSEALSWAATLLGLRYYGF